MKIEEVPQDSRFFENVNVRDFYYALNEEGNYCKVASLGWDAKNDALSLTWDHIMEDAETIRQEVLAKKKSPLAYHMEIRLFDINILASYSGIPKRTIKKHLKYEEFERIERAFLEKYAETLHITVEELKKV
jgi:hypothetical protein